MHVRGRRRIGKTELLKKISVIYGGFYFSGIDDESDLNCRLRLVRSWAEYSEDFQLLNYKESLLTWEIIFQNITKFIRESSRQKQVISFIKFLRSGQKVFYWLML